MKRAETIPDRNGRFAVIFDAEAHFAAVKIAVSPRQVATITGMYFVSRHNRAFALRRVRSLGVFRAGAHTKMKPLFFVSFATMGLMLLYPHASSTAEPGKHTATRVGRAPAAPAQQGRMAATRMMLLERKRALREQLQKSMPLHEEKIRNQNDDYEMKREMYEKNLISKNDVDRSEQALAGAQLDAGKIREWIAEDDRALALTAEAAEESKGLRQGPKADLARAALIRFDGASSWSIHAFEKIESFFRRQFGKPPPVSAMGQSDTHDRLGLDHRDAVDIAVRPDSAEGRALMAYLRRAGIPFTAFRGRLSSISTGAHIHVGRPSPRLLEVKQQRESAQERNENGEHG